MRIQSASHTCGAWLIAGFVGYILGIYEAKGNTLNREKLFNILLILMSYLLMQWTQKHDDDTISMTTLKMNSQTKKTMIFYSILLLHH